MIRPGPGALSAPAHDRPWDGPGRRGIQQPV